SYSRVLAHYPCVVFSAVLVFSLTCLVVVVTLGSPPTFDDPKLGFEARGTVISNRLRAFEELLDTTHDGFFEHRAPSGQNGRHRRQLNPTIDPKVGTRDEADVEMEIQVQSLDGDVSNISYTHEAFFCDAPSRIYARIVFHSSGDLFTLRSIQIMCSIEKDLIRSQPTFHSACIHTSRTKQCCRSWSLGNYIAMLRNKTSCLHISEMDVYTVQKLLRRCHDYYLDGLLTADCFDPGGGGGGSSLCRGVPRECVRHNAVYHLLYHITDSEYIIGGDLKYAVSFLPVAAGVGCESLYQSIESMLPMEESSVAVVAMDFGIKQELFDHYLQRDSVWFALALCSLFLCMWLYTCSLFVTLMSVVSMALSLICAYFFYALVIEVSFFPFMNLLTAVILLGIGADDVFICCKMWTLAKLEKNAGTLEKLVSDMLKHAALSMFVTSLTTSAAFFAGYVTHITALKCFALFSGIAVICNFVLMVTWIPATLVFHEKWCLQCCFCLGPPEYDSGRSPCYYLCLVPRKLYSAFCDTARLFFSKGLPWVVVRLRYLWLVTFGLLGVGSIVIVFYHPRLKLPSSDNFQMFAHSHPFEVYDLQMKKHFSFEVQTEQINMPLTVVFGAKSVDNGNHFNPFSKGELVHQPGFNPAAPASQRWLLEFCRKLRTAEYYQPQHGMQLTNCFIENFVQYMKRSCEDPMGIRLTPCCESSSFPFSEPIFNRCMEDYLDLMGRTSHLLQHHSPAGLRYSNEDSSLVGLVIEFSSTLSFSLNYAVVQSFFEKTESFMDEALSSAPDELQGGWFISFLDFYDLQRSIAYGTPIAIGVSLAIATLVAFLTTLNLLVTVYAMFSIAFAIFTTIASLVLLGWELNILESVTISIAVGLSIDFSLHYGMAYRLSPDLDREMRVVSAIVRMGSPVAMAAFTTFFAGAFMMPSTVLAYRQLGTFLMLLMTVSWLYGTLFFLSLLCVAGPQGGFGQLHWPSCSLCCCYCCFHSEHRDKTVYAMSESTMSTSSANHANHSEVHELEPLTAKESKKRPPHLNAWRHSSQESTDVFDFPDSPIPDAMVTPIPQTNGCHPSESLAQNKTNGIRSNQSDAP
ncbi:hypothetical protein CAPTEDRAFT_126822, partial [Capitella teleta]